MIDQDFYTEVDFVADEIFNKKDSLIVTEPQTAMFYYFKKSGKYYNESKGYIPMINDVWTREELLRANGGYMPGLSTTGSSFRIVVVPEIEAVYGWPQMLEPDEE